jgi:hypothetical protein
VFGLEVAFNAFKALGRETEGEKRVVYAEISSGDGWAGSF